MATGRQRKRLVKAARKVPLERICAVLGCRPNEPPAYFLLNSHDYELIWGWSRKRGLVEMSICDDALAVACAEHLRSLGLVFESPDHANAYSQPHGWVDDARDDHG